MAFKIRLALASWLLLLHNALPSSSFVSPHVASWRQLRPASSAGGFARAKQVFELRTCRARARARMHCAKFTMVDDLPLPVDPVQLQERLWAEADVLPGISETLLQLAKTQETGVSDLGFMAKGPIAKGDIIISVPMRYALVVNMKSGAKGDELPSDVRLALQLLRVLDLTEAGESKFEDDVKAFWRAYTLRILPRETFAAIAWEEVDIESLQYERTVEEVKALRSRLEELCKQTLEETEQVEEDEDEDEDNEPVPGKRKVTISGMQAVRLPGGKTMMEDATLRWALSIVRSRSFMFDENDDSPVVRRAIVPVADLFNHQPEGPLLWASMDEELTNPWQVLRGDDGMMYVDICAHRDYSVGEEVLLPYGLETSADLLCSHGIVLKENAADYVPVYSDAVELVGDIVELELDQDTAVAQAKLNLIQVFPPPRCSASHPPSILPARANAFTQHTATLLYADPTFIKTLF